MAEQSAFVVSVTVICAVAGYLATGDVVGGIVGGVSLAISLSIAEMIGVD